jgi:predicted AAA+ superfamily ATPase
VDDRRRDPRLAERLIRSLGRNVATAASIAHLGRDVNGADGHHKPETISAYLDAMSRLMIVEDLAAWAPSLRSRTRLRATPVRPFVDPSLAVAALHATPARLKADLEWTGLVFENLVVRDLRVYAQALDGQVFAYRDESGLEADAIVELSNGRWAAFEVKLGTRQVDAAAANLTRPRDRVDTRVVGDPLALVVITSSGYAYTRDDGVSVVPIAALGP